MANTTFGNDLSITILIVVTTIIALLLGTFVVYASRSRRRGLHVEACKRIGLPYSEVLTDDYAVKHDHQTKEGTWSVKSLWIYPIKSCGGVELEKSTVTGLGLQYDRQFSFAHLVNLQKDAEAPPEYGWRFLTQRQVPALATVKMEVWVPDPSSPAYSPQHPNVLSGGIIVIKWPATISYKWRHMEWNPEHRVEIPSNPTPEQVDQNQYEACSMEIWNNTPSALRISSTESSHGRKGHDTWIRDLLKYLRLESQRQNPPRPSKSGNKEIPGFSFDLTKPFALLRIASQEPRSVFRNAPTQSEIGYQPIVGLQDAYPVNLMNVASVRDVASKLEPGSPPLSVKNFRTNIVIEGGKAYTEDDWKRIRIGSELYYTCCRTARCLLPNVNQATGKKAANEPNKTMMSFRKIDKGCPTKACLGMQVVPTVNEEREIKVGDEIEVLETGEHIYRKS